MGLRRNTALALSAALASACAGVRVAEVDREGRAVTAGGETWKAQEGIVLFERGGEVHVVSLDPGRTFDVAVRPGPDGRLAWPPNAPFEAVGGVIRLRAPAGPSRIAGLVAARQLHPHDDHFHLTSRYANPDWQELYAFRDESSPLPPLQRQLAASILATLLDERIPGSDDEATSGALRRLDSIIGKASRAVRAGLPGKQVLGIITHDYEISDGGGTLDIEGQRFHSGTGVRFAYDGDHFHVEAESGTWVQAVRLDGQEPGAFEFAPSIFYEVKDGVVQARPLSTRWQQLAESQQIRFVRDHWHATEAYEPLVKSGLLHAAGDAALPVALQDRARGRALDVLRIRLDVGSPEEFEARLAAVDRMIQVHAREFEKEKRAARK